MTKTDNILPDWISRQASIGPNVIVEGELTDDNIFWYLLTACCPQIFNCYAIVLSPFWINWKVKELANSGQAISEEQIGDSDFQRLSWRQYFETHGKEFDLSTAYRTKEEIGKQILLDKWPKYLWFPAEGECESEELRFILSHVKELYGDTKVYYHYCYLKTTNCEKDIIFSGNLSGFDELINEQDIYYNPTSIYPENQEWCIVSDYDLPFTYIGGTKELIDRITHNNEFEIFRIEPRFKEKTEKNIIHKIYGLSKKVFDKIRKLVYIPH